MVEGRYAEKIKRLASEVQQVVKLTNGKGFMASVRRWPIS
jgi:hypothetical protein